MTYYFGYPSCNDKTLKARISIIVQRNPVRSLPNCFNTSQPYNVYLREFSASIIVISFANNKTLSTMGIYFYVGKY